MEIGMGQHGEPGTGPSRLMTADETAQVMIERLVAAVDARSGDRLLVILNGSGATTLMELFIVYRAVHRLPARARHRARLSADRRVPDRAGDGRLPDVRRQDGRRIDPTLERPVRYAVS